MGRLEAKTLEGKRLRRFGLVVGGAFVGLAALLFFKERELWRIVVALGALLMALGLVAPAVLRPVERIWMKAARAMGWVMTRVILGIAFIILFAPAGLVIRLLGKDPLGLRFRPDEETYWNEREEPESPPERMERMF